MEAFNNINWGTMKLVSFAEPLSEVYHDDTLAGKGTKASKLTVVGGGGGADGNGIYSGSGTVPDSTEVAVENNMFFKGTVVGFVGLQYADDYSANFLDNSIVSKRYVDNAVGAVSGDGNGIYSGSDTVPSETTATVTDWMAIRSTGSNLIGSLDAQLKISEAEGAVLFATNVVDPSLYTTFSVMDYGQYSTIIHDDQVNLWYKEMNLNVSPLNNEYMLRRYFADNDLGVIKEGKITLEETVVKLQQGNTDIGTVSFAVECTAPGKSKIVAYSDAADFPGIVYDVDYSANFNDRSLVDKAYVDSVAAGGGGNGIYGGSGTIASGADATLASNDRFRILWFSDDPALDFNDLGHSVAMTADFMIFANPSYLNGAVSSAQIYTYDGAAADETYVRLISRMMGSGVPTGDETSITVDATRMYLSSKVSGYTVALNLNGEAGRCTYIDNGQGLGILYGGDYHENYADNSLITQGDVRKVTNYGSNGGTYNMTSTDRTVVYSGNGTATIVLPSGPVNDQPIILNIKNRSEDSSSLTVNLNSNRVDGSTSNIVLAINNSLTIQWVPSLQWIKIN